MPALKRTYTSTEMSSSQMGGGSGSYKRPKTYVQYQKKKAQYRRNRALGRVSARDSTLARAGVGAPYPAHKRVTFDYSNSLTPYAPSASIGKLAVASSDLFDFDRTTGNTFGNKQPLYFDQYFTSTGPYKLFKVFSWTTTYTVVNMSDTAGVTVFALPPHPDPTEIDTLSEAEAYPGVIRYYLTPKSGSKSMAMITVTGNIKDQYDSWSDTSTFVGGYNSSPANIAYGGLFFSTGDGTTTGVNVEVAVRHMVYAEAQSNDTIIS